MPINKSFCDLFIAHTFHPTEEHFMPRYLIDAENLLFEPTVVNKAVYRTLMIKNTAPNYPVYFNIENDSNSSWYVKPRKGLIKVNEHQIFVFKYLPKQETHSIEKCQIKLNEMQKFIREMMLICTAEIPRLVLPNDAIVYFKPTCKGNGTTKTYEIVNQSRTTVNYEWKLSYECKGLFDVDKQIGFIEPYEKMVSFLGRT